MHLCGNRHGSLGYWVDVTPSPHTNEIGLHSDQSLIDNQVLGTGFTKPSSLIPLNFTQFNMHNLNELGYADQHITGRLKNMQQVEWPENDNTPCILWYQNCKVWFQFLIFRIILSRKEEGTYVISSITFCKNTLYYRLFIIFLCMLMSDSEFTLVLKPHLINICDSLLTCLHSLPQVVVFAL